MSKAGGGRLGRRFPPDWWVSLGLAAVVIVVYAVSERLAVNDGFGWDGTQYGRWAQDFPRALREGVDSHLARRILPSAVVYSGLGLLGADRTAENVVRGFVVLDAVAVAGGLFAWRRAVLDLGVGPPCRLLGMIALIVNFAVLKWIPYYPVLTDASAFGLAALMLVCWTSGRAWALAGVSVLGGLTWPTLMAPALLLIVFPREAPALPVAVSENRSGTLLACATGLATFGALALILAWGRAGFETPERAAKVAGRLGLVNPLGPLTLASAAVLAIGVFFASRPLWEAFATRRLWPEFQVDLVGRVLRAGAVYGIAALVIARFTARHTLGVRDFVVTVGFTALRWPLVSLVAHAVFFGPLVLLAALRWRAVCKAVSGQGIGMVLCFLLGLLLALDSESRHVFPYFPLLVAFAVKGIHDVGWTGGSLLGFAALSALFSKAWLPIGPLPSAPGVGALTWQTARLAMQIGPRMSLQMYALNAAALILTAMGFRRVLVRLRPRGSSEAR